MKYPILLIACVFSQVEFALARSEEQRQQAFDSIYYHTYMNTASTDPDHALRVADSLYRASADDLQRIRSLKLVSDMYYRKGNRDSTVHYALRAAQIASRAGIHEWQARIYGVLSTQHRKNGLVKQGRKFLEKGLKASEKIKDREVFNDFKGNAYQEKGYYAGAEGNFHEAITYFKKANEFHLELPDSPKRANYLSLSEERQGKCYLELSMIDSAKYHYTQALELAEKASKEETVMKGFMYNGLGLVCLQLEDYEKAYDFLCRGLDIACTANFPDLQIEVYESLARYYRDTGDMDNYALYNEKYLKIRDRRIEKDRDYSNNMIANAEQKLEEAYFSHRTTVITMSAILLLTITGGSLLYRNRRKREYRRFQKIIREMSENNKARENRTPIETDADKEYMPNETEERILTELDALERGNFYLQKEVSLSALAARLNTNSRYVSYVINKHKGTGFNGYVNQIRVQRSIVDLKNNPGLWSYKIAYLAKQYGFSSHSKFTAIFKGITGITPSIFIMHLKKEAELVTH